MSSLFLAAKFFFALYWLHIKNWVDAHTNLPFGARWFALSRCGSKEQPSRQRQPSHEPEGFLFSESALAPTLIMAYLATHYRVDAATPFVLKVGEPSDSLAQFLTEQSAQCAAYLTACNPFSQPLSDADNLHRQSALENELNRRSLQFIRGTGQDSQGEWPGEASFLIFGLSLEASRALARQYEQNAFVWCAKDAIPQLILLK